MRGVLLVIVALTLVTAAFAEVDVSLQKLQPAATAGFAATCKTGADGVSVTFRKEGEERRFLAVAGMPQADPTGAKTAQIGYRLDLRAGKAPRAAVLVYEKDGGSWYKVAATEAALAQATTARVSVAGLLQTAFSSDANGQLDWSTVDRVWAGFVFDGPAEGQLLVSSVRLVDQVVLPTGPVRLTGTGVGAWSSGQDPAVKAKLATVPEGPGGKECMKYEINVPAGSHMYAIPTVPITVEDLEGYSALRFKYRAQIPAGMRLLVTLSEAGGTSYFCEPAGPWSAEWGEMTIPLSAFKWASWSSKDDNGKLDLAKLTSISVGTHGVPAQAGDGWIMVTDLEMVP
jgi:hypothetical protein